jgi:hypothetical protein
MTRIPRTTEFALPTTRIDLTRHAPARKLTRFRNADKLVSNRPIEPRIPARDLQIGITNPRQQHTHEHLVRIIRFRSLFNC